MYFVLALGGYMRKLKITICAMLLLFSGIVFAACGDDRLSFDASQFVITNTEFTYDGDAHIFDVSYGDYDINVRYSLDGANFMSGLDLGLADAGTYKVYYKVSSEGYKDYVSGQVDFVIKQLDVTATVQDYYYVISSDISIADIPYEVNLEGEGLTDDLKAELLDSIRFDTTQSVLGDDDIPSDKPTMPGDEIPVAIIRDSLNPNYNVNTNGGTIHFVTETVLVNADESIGGYYSTLTDAITNAADGATIKLYADITLDSMIEITKTITIDGQGKYTIKAADVFTGTGSKETKNSTVSIFNINTADKVLTLSGVTLDGNGVSRGVSAFAGKLVIIDGTRIENGKKVDNRRSGGVFITNAASFEMKSGVIVDNDANDTQYTKYCADLWIGANAEGSMVVIDGGEIGSVFVNSNEFSANNPGSFTLDGGLIHKLYVEYDAGYGASFKLISGEVLDLYISTNVCGVAVKVSGVAGDYMGGIVATVKNTEDVVTAYNAYASIVADEEDEITLYVQADNLADIASLTYDKLVVFVDSADDVADVESTADEVVVLDEVLANWAGTILGQ